MEKQCAKRDSKQRFHTLLQCESLEGRNLLSATATPEVQIESVTNNAVSGMTASQISTAYGFNKVSESGAGQTIAIIDSYNDPNIKSDLATFDATMGLAAANLTVVNQSGGSSLPQTDSGWDLEIALDVEWAHAIAPGANILLVEASSDNLNDLLSAVQYATTVSSVSVVSMSWGSSEFNGETSYDSYFTTPAGHQGITFVGASGDDGSPGIWPSISDNVLAVGGTTLNVSSTGTFLSETAWSGSGGGTSQFESEPSWQDSVQSTGKRTSPDVSYDADPNSGFAVYDSVATGRQSGWFQVGGTSDAAPQWAALLADANQGRVAAGETTLNGAQAAIYSLPSTDFHDITSGSNGGFSAKAGYDEVTGRGTPIANLLIPGLVSYTGSSSGSGSGSSGSGSSGSGSSGSGSSGSGSGSGGGSSGGSSGGSHGGSGHHHGYGGYGGFGGRLDEIGSSSLTSAAVGEAFVSTELAMSDTAGQSEVVSNSLTGIPQTNVSTSIVVSSAASSATPSQGSGQSAARLAASATRQEGDLADINNLSASNAGLGSGNLSGATISRQSDLTSINGAHPDVDASAATSHVLSHASSTSRGVTSNELVSVDSVELSPAMREAVWLSLDIEVDDPTMIAVPVVEEASLAESSVIDHAAPAGDAAMPNSSPLAMVMAGIALGWAKSQAEDRRRTPVRQLPGRRFH